tara:strand:+ start:403 stop:687 length:285 start_codon:yes stop_codon:yes gene_type:complete
MKEFELGTWYPIETAPQEVGNVLLDVGKGYPVMGTRADIKDNPYQWIYADLGIDFMGFHDDGAEIWEPYFYTDTDYPKQWMPLPMIKQEGNNNG